MFRLRSAIAAAALVACATPVFAAGHGNINKRQDRQQARIFQGVKSGELTLRETQKLEAREGRIAALEAKDRRTGGGLSAKERAQLERDLNEQSRDIYRQKHDGQGK